jgi:hypothetical protein
MIKESDMKRQVVKLAAMVMMICSICILTLSPAQAKPDLIWCNKMSDMLQSLQATYPGSDFEPYFQQHSRLQAATTRGDKAALRAGITDAIRMVGRSDIGHDAAVELVNYLYVWRERVTTPGEHTLYR